MNSNNNYRKVFSYHNFPFIMTVAAKLGSKANINKRNEIRYHFAGSDGVLSELVIFRTFKIWNFAAIEKICHISQFQSIDK